MRIDHEQTFVTLEDIVNPNAEGRTVTITVNGKPITLSPKENLPWVNGKTVSLDYVIRPHDQIQYNSELRGEQQYIVTDLFRDYQPDETFLKKGGRILVNGVESGYTTPLKDGDEVKLVTE